MSEDIHHGEASFKNVREQITMLVMSIERTPTSCEGYTAALNTLDMFAGEHESLGEVVGRAHSAFLMHTRRRFQMKMAMISGAHWPRQILSRKNGQG